MFIEVPRFHETSPALQNFWLRAWIGCERFSVAFIIALIIFNIASLMLFNVDVSVSLEVFNISRNCFFSSRSSLASLIRNVSLCDADSRRSRYRLFFIYELCEMIFRIFFLAVTLWSFSSSNSLLPSLVIWDTTSSWLMTLLVFSSSLSVTPVVLLAALSILSPSTEKFCFQVTHQSWQNLNQYH